jgi:hypothetical protein
MQLLRAIETAFVTAMIVGTVSGCATETHQALPTQQTASAERPYAGVKTTIVLGNFAIVRPTCVASSQTV